MEIAEYIKAAYDNRNHNERFMYVVAYNIANLTALGILAPQKFPRSAAEAFPNIFGGDDFSDGIPVRNWQESKIVMKQIQKMQREVKR